MPSPAEATRFAATVKNLQHLLAWDPAEDGVEEAARTALRRVQYRDVALPPAVAEEHPDLADWKRVHVPASPGPGFDDLAHRLARAGEAPRRAAEAVLLAGAHVCPVVVVGDDGPSYEGLGVHAVRTEETLDRETVARHRAIAGYAVLDLVDWSTRHAARLWEEETDPSTWRAERAGRIEDDLDRWWRLEPGDEGVPFLRYVDPARVLADADLDGLRKRRDPADVAGGLGIGLVVDVGREVEEDATDG